MSVSSIGTSADYSTVALWAAACPANLITHGSDWIGEQKNETHTLSGTVTLGSGVTVDATHRLILRCQTGASWRDNANVRTNAFAYSTSTGAAMDGTTGFLDIRADYTEINNSQVRNTSALENLISTVNPYDFLRIDSCILDHTGLVSSNGGPLSMGTGQSSVVVNTLAITRNGQYGEMISGQGKVYGCTLIAIGIASPWHVVSSGYDRIVMKDSAFFGCTTFGLSGTTTAAGSSNNATDLSSAGAGSNHQLNLTFVDQFLNNANNYQATATGALPNNGIQDLTNLTYDATGYTRAATPTIGAWEITRGQRFILH